MSNQSSNKKPEGNKSQGKDMNHLNLQLAVTGKRRKNQKKALRNAKRLTERNQKESWNLRKQLQLDVQ